MKFLIMILQNRSDDSDPPKFFIRFLEPTARYKVYLKSILSFE